MNPARCHRHPPGSKPAHTPGRGNLARATSNRAGHFLFRTQTAKQFKTYFANPNEAGLSSLPVRVGAGAATNRQRPSAMSRPHPLSFQAFLKIDQNSHLRLLSQLKPSLLAFRMDGKAIREGR